MKLLRLAALLLLVVPGLRAQTVFNPATGHLYTLSTTATTIQAARAAALAAGGYLVAINDAAENAFLQANFIGRRWIGLSDEITEGTFLWDSGEPFVYTNWCAGEPNNAGAAGEDYVELLTAQGCWNDQPASGNGLITNGIIELPFGPQYQLNQPNFAIAFDNAQATILAPGRRVACGGASVSVSVASPLAGNLFDVALSFAAPAAANSGSALATAGGQIVNINVTQPFVFFYGGLAPFTGLFPGSFTQAFAAPPAPFAMTAQGLIADPSHADGFTLSQAAFLDVQGFALPPTPIAGPTGDDTQVQVNTGCISFYNRSYTTIFVQSNGRMMFGGGNTTFTPSAAAFMIQPPSFGVWTDLNPSTGGTITINSSAPGVIDVAYAAVNYFGTTIPNTFTLSFDTNTGVASVVGLGGLALSGAQMLIGISGGADVVATNPGPVNYSPGGSGTTGFTANGTDIIHAQATQGSVTTGIGRIDWYPNGVGNFDWISQ